MKKHIALFLLSSMLTLFSVAQDKIAKGSTVKILEIAKGDTYYEERAAFLGKNATALGELTKKSDGFYSGTLEITESGRTCYFTSIKVAKEETKTKTVTASKDLFSGNIPAGARFKILEVPSDDAYFSDRDIIEGKTGTATSSYTLDDDGYTSGSVETDDGKSYYFYKVKLGKTDTKAPAKISTVSSSGAVTKMPTYITGTIKKGTAVYLADISPDDSYYSDRYEKIGKKGKIAKNDMTMKEDGYYAGDFQYDDGSTAYFYKAKFTKDPVPALEKPKDSKSDDSSGDDYAGFFSYSEWDDVTNDGTIEEGDKVQITAVSPDDSYYDDRADYIGKKGVITNIEYDDYEDGYGGDVTLEDGSEVYFYLVKLKKAGTRSTPVKGNTESTDNNASSISKNTRVVVTDVDPDDSFYSDKSKYVGKTGKVAEELNTQGNGCYSGKILFDDNTDAYFYKVKVTILK